MLSIEIDDSAFGFADRHFSPRV